MKNDHDYTKVGVFFLLFIGATVALWAGIRSADAHDWYPMECCHGMDCAPVDKVQLLTPINADATPAMVVTTKYGTVVVPPDFPAGSHTTTACMLA